MTTSFGLKNNDVNHICPRMSEGAVCAAFGDAGWNHMVAFYTVGDSPETEETFAHFNNSSRTAEGSRFWAELEDANRSASPDLPF